MDAEGTFADRFDGERQLWIVVVGRLREVQRLEGLVQVGVCIECLAGHQLLAFPLDSPLAGGGVERYQAVGKEIGVAEVQKILAHVFRLGKQVLHAGICFQLGMRRWGGSCCQQHKSCPFHQLSLFHDKYMIYGYCFDAVKVEKSTQMKGVGMLLM